MAILVECLNCGATRWAQRDGSRRTHLDDHCSRCGYVGWAPTNALSEAARRALRDRPLPRRRLTVV